MIKSIYIGLFVASTGNTVRASVGYARRAHFELALSGAKLAPHDAKGD